MKSKEVYQLKKKLFFILFLNFLLALTACSNAERSSNKLNSLDKEGIAPYELSENEQDLLEAFGMSDTSQIITFNAPKETQTINVHVYRLVNDNMWEQIGGGAISSGAERKSSELLTGTFTIQLRENYCIDFNINYTGQYSFQTEPIIPDQKIVGSTRGFLESFQNIELNTEIPVAVMVYDSGTKMRSYTPQDYFEPSKFEGMDLVQVVTLEFSDQSF